MSGTVVQGPQQWKDNAAQSASDVDGGGGGPHPPDMDIYGWRLDQHDKQIEGIGRKLGDIKALITGLPTRSDLRSTTVAIVVAIIGTLVAVSGLFLAASNNQLSAFQAGLSAVQTHIAVTPSPK